MASSLLAESVIVISYLIVGTDTFAVEKFNFVTDLLVGSINRIGLLDDVRLHRHGVHHHD